MNAAEVKILVVDDEPLILETVANLFRMFNFDVDLATSGNQALPMTKIKQYNLVLTDIRMPDGDGIELTKNIKSQNALSPSVLFMSGFSDIMNEEIYHIGAEGKFCKPFDIQAIKKAIKTCLLAPEVKWPNPETDLPCGLHIEKVGSDINELESAKAVVFGRGGFFISHQFAPPAKGTAIQFSIQYKNPEPTVFKGKGVVRWIQQPGKAGIPPGLGIEIISMSAAESVKYKQLFGHLIPFIPSVSRYAA